MHEVATLEIRNRRFGTVRAARAWECERGRLGKKELPLYRDVLKVSEYFLFDPRSEYLNPPLQGFRLVGGDYVPIEPVAGRLPSEVLGLHLEHDGAHLRLFDPATNQWLPTRLERAEAAEVVQRRLAEEIEHLRREIEALRDK